MNRVIAIFSYLDIIEGNEASSSFSWDVTDYILKLDYEDLMHMMYKVSPFSRLSEVMDAPGFPNKDKKPITVYVNIEIIDFYGVPSGRDITQEMIDKKRKEMESKMYIVANYSPFAIIGLYDNYQKAQEVESYYRKKDELYLKATGKLPTVRLVEVDLNKLPEDMEKERASLKKQVASMKSSLAELEKKLADLEQLK